MNNGNGGSDGDKLKSVDTDGLINQFQNSKLRREIANN